MSATEVLQRVASALDQCGIDYMLTGSLASAYYGTSRSTQDIDVVIDASPEQLRALIKYLQEAQFYAEVDAAMQALQRRSLFNVIELASGWKIDLIIRKARNFSEEEFRRRRQVDFNGVRLFVASAEDILLAKLEWAKMASSARQLDDAAGILRLQWESLDREYLKKWVEGLHLSVEWSSALEKAKLSE
jgi:hypothetical protein